MTLGHIFIDGDLELKIWRRYGTKTTRLGRLSRLNGGDSQVVDIV